MAKTRWYVVTDFIPASKLSDILVRPVRFDCHLNADFLQASPAALATLCDAVETAVSDRVGLSTPTVDVFVRENLFPDAISSSQERLAVAARTEDGLVAWGNTNTQVCV